MEKNIKDYLHLYLGCEIYIPSIEDDIEMREDYQLLAVSQHDCTIVHPEHGISSFPKEDIKPILRPLSNMTPEEMKEYRLLDLPVIKTMHKYIIESAFYTKWLLSKHFDLFGLIPDLAIDKTTLK